MKLEFKFDIFDNLFWIQCEISSAFDPQDEISQNTEKNC